jgi:hypothetical protein
MLTLQIWRLRALNSDHHVGPGAGCLSSVRAHGSRSTPGIGGTRTRLDQRARDDSRSGRSGHTQLPLHRGPGAWAEGLAVFALG